MDENRARKLEMGREKLEAYKKRKQKRENPSDDTSDSSLSLNSLDLPDNTKTNLKKPEKTISNSSTISEHLDSHLSSIENDRSFPEINLEPKERDLFLDLDEYERISQENKPNSLSLSSKSDQNEAKNNVQVILDDILNDKLFVSKSDGTRIEKSDSCSSRDVSLNIFEGVSLDDSSINNYVSKLKAFDVDETIKEKDLGELEDLKSISSFNTTTTEYKGYHDESAYKIVNYQTAIAQRDAHIQHLTESLQEAIANRDKLQLDSENFAKQTEEFQKQLLELTIIFKQHECFNSKQWSPIRRKFFKGQSKDSSLSSSLSDFAQEKEEEMGIERVFGRFEEVLSPNQLIILNELKSSVELYVQKKITEVRDEHKREVEELQNELKTKHLQELEELRTYYEKKCLDVEKNYSEEIYSQPSQRKMSDSSTNSDFVQDLIHDSKALGPGGDANPCSQLATPKRSLKNVSKSDLLKIKSELNQFLNLIQEEIVPDKDFCLEKLPILTKSLFNDVQSELRNKYNAELEILREDFENKIDEKTVEFEENLTRLKREHQEELDACKYELEEALKSLQNQLTTQEVGSTNDFEIEEVIKSYERRLEEQVSLARLDIIDNLMQKIKILAQNSNDSEWPIELLQIRNCFREKYEAEIEEMKVKHEEEVRQLKEEHFKVLSGALERARRRSLKENESFGKAEMEILKDRDSLKKSNTILKNIINELLKYFTKCEDELNKTLIDEILKHGLDSNLSQIEIPETNQEPSLSESFIKRVHFTPNLNLTAIDSSIDSNVSIDFKNELGICLDRLKSDANMILTLTTNLKKPFNPTKSDLEEKIDSLTDQMIATAQVNDDLETQLDEVKGYCRSLESERVSLENQIEQLVEKQKILEEDLEISNKKITELIESGRKEIISEGYGENSLDGKVGNLMELQEKARHLAAEWKNGSDHPLLKLIEELCREGERINEEAKKEKEDLKQQIEVAEKKLRSTDRFLEEQAMEREQERNDAQKEVEKLREMLKEMEKEKQNRELIVKEVEELEDQMRKMTRLQELNEEKHEEVEKERREAIDKIQVLRDIIRDLEGQIERKTISEGELKEFIEKLEPVIKQQSLTIEELSEQLESYKCGPDAEFYKSRVVSLEKEIQQLRLNNELVGNEGAIKEIQVRLHEFENTIDKKTKDLEGLHSALSTGCSTPSEEMSYRDHLRPNTPGGVFDECDVPLQQLARLKEKLIKHSRAEDAAVKRIRDLEMQLASTKQELEESQSEKDLLQTQVTEQIVLLSSLQMRLDEQRLKAEQNQKQANTSLELRIYDLENELQNLNDLLHAKDKNIKQLNKIIDETKKRLEDREKELNNREDEEILVNFEKEIEKLKEENVYLKNKIDSDAQNVKILPGLVDNIIADKNSDIEKLRLKLDDTQKQLESFLSLNLDYDQLKQISQLKSSERGFSDFLNLTEAPIMRKNETKIDSIENSMNFLLREPNETKIDFKFAQNSSEIPKKSVHFDDTTELLRLKNQIDELKKDNEILNENTQKINDLELHIDKLTQEQKDLKIELAEKKMKLMEIEGELKASLDDHKRKDEMYLTLAKEKREIEGKITQNEAKKIEIEERNRLENELDELNKKYFDLKNNYDKKINELDELNKKFLDLNLNLNQKSDNLKSLQKDFDEKLKDNEQLFQDNQKLNESNQKLSENIQNLTENNQKLNENNQKLSENHQKLTENYQKLNESNQKLTENNQQLFENSQKLSEDNEKLFKENQKLSKEIKNQTEQLNNLNEKIKALNDLIVDKNCEIEILNEDLTRYQNEIQNLNEFKNLNHQEEISSKNIEIIQLKTIQEDLKKEINHLQEYLNEKDKIIEQMQRDTKSLHANLETIQSKIQETGNIVDLRKRLQEEKHLNAVLREEIESLKNPELPEKSASIEDIRGEVKKQLEYSEFLDSNIIQALSSEDEANKDGNVEKKSSDSFPLDQNKLIEGLRLQIDGLRRELEDTQTELEKERENVRKLSTLLDKERFMLNSLEIEDANLIERLRIQLESVLDQKEELEGLFEQEKKANFELTNEIKRLKSDLSSSSKTEVTEYKKLPSLETSQEILKLKQEIFELTEEINGFKKVNSELKSELKNLKTIKDEENIDLKYTKNMLGLKLNEIENLEVKIQDFKTKEFDLKEKITNYKFELDQKNREIQQNRDLLSELERERIGLKKEQIILNDRLRELEEDKKINEILQREKENLSDLNSPVPDKLINKMRELTEEIKLQMEENKILTGNLTQMALERSKLLEKIRKLERNHRNSNENLYSSNQNHVLAKYLRSESYRKALIYQKQYLIKLLASYQEIEPNLNNIFQPKYPLRLKNSKQKFKSYVLLIVAVQRMKFMVFRWHSGVRGHKYQLNHQKETVKQDFQTRFEVGQPVSSQNFYQNVNNHQSNDDLGLGASSIGHIRRDEESKTPCDDLIERSSWSGNSPPQKERDINASGDFAPLQTPSLLSEYIQRFDNIQKRLGLTFDKINS